MNINIFLFKFLSIVTLTKENYFLRVSLRTSKFLGLNLQISKVLLQFLCMLKSKVWCLIMELELVRVTITWLSFIILRFLLKCIIQIDIKNFSSNLSHSMCNFAFIIDFFFLVDGHIQHNQLTKTQMNARFTSTHHYEFFIKIEKKFTIETCYFIKDHTNLGHRYTFWDKWTVKVSTF